MKQTEALLLFEYTFDLVNTHELVDADSPPVGGKIQIPPGTSRQIAPMAISVAQVVTRK